MKKNKKTALLTGVVLGAIATTSGLSFAANLDRDVVNDERFQKHQLSSCSEEREIKREAIKTALEANDYDAFKQAVGEDRAEKVTEEIFAKLIEMHEARESGDEDKIKTVKEELKELGFEGHKGKHGKKGRHGGEGNHEKREAVKTALEANDYDAFKQAVGEDRAEKVTEEIFAKLIEMHEARESGDEDKVKTVKEELKELGFERFKKFSRGR